MKQPRIIDNDEGEITVRLDGIELRGWSYKDDDERRKKMLCAREYVEGWCDALKNYFSAKQPQRPQGLPHVERPTFARLRLVPSMSSAPKTER